MDQSSALALCPAVGVSGIEKLRSYLRSIPRDHMGNRVYPDDDPDREPDWMWASDLYCSIVGEERDRIRTRRQFDDAVDACRVRIEGKPEIKLAASPAPPEAARQFVKWIRDTGRCDTYSNEGLSALYAEHCAALRIAPASEAHMRKHMTDFAGAFKSMQDEKGRRGAKRHRPTKWTITPSLATVMQQRQQRLKLAA